MLTCFFTSILFSISPWSETPADTLPLSSEWTISALPSSVRLDPTTLDVIIDDKRAAYPAREPSGGDLLHSNWIYDGSNISLSAARGEYVSFQVVIANKTNEPLKYISVKIPAFRNNSTEFKNKPELFLEWSVEVQTPSTGYPKASLGKGWYPDALIPFQYVQQDSSQLRGRWVFPLWLPDFNNRIPDQRSLIVWVDQYIPFDAKEAPASEYSSEVAVTIKGQTQKIPVKINVWNFAVPNENKFMASLQQEGFLSNMDPKLELEVYQLFKRNRIGLMDPNYRPALTVTNDKKVVIDWTEYDNRLKKYLTGEAFTKKYGYEYGPGYNEPIETLMLPFDVYGKHHTRGWPDVGPPETEKDPKNRAVYVKAIQEVRKHLTAIIPKGKTDLIMYLNGLDESYFPEAWARMVDYGNLFQEHFPEVHYRVDGGYSEEAMQIIHKSIDYLSAHTLNYNLETIKKFRKLGVKDWLYGPMIYESKVNGWVGSSTFLDLPLVNDRAISWSCWKYGTKSWLSWGVAYAWERAWYDPELWKDVRHGAETDALFDHKKTNGNALLAYSPGVVPNVSGVCPSIRLKMMRDGVQEYEYLRLLAALDGNNVRADSIVNTIIGEPFGDRSIGRVDVWKYDARKWDEARTNTGILIHDTRQKVK
ncbi:MAG: glycoside hydrolase domain-containing protein [Cyclobacteriaceae bacterium]